MKGFNESKALIKGFKESKALISMNLLSSSEDVFY